MRISYTLRLLMGVSGLTVALGIPMPSLAQEPIMNPSVDAQPSANSLSDPESITLNAEVSPDDGTANTPPDDTEMTSLNEAWSGSLMFPDEMAAGMMRIYREYLRRQQMGQPQDAQNPTGTSAIPGFPDIIQRLAPGEEPKEIPEEVLKLSLNSIVYEAPSDWSIWVNGQRYNREQAMEGFRVDRSDIKVVRTTNEQVTYLWTPIAASFDKVQRRWQEKAALGEGFVSPQVAQQDQVEFNQEARTVTITMRPNQTFISQFMTVMEGVNAIRAIKAVSPQPASEAGLEGEGAQENIPLSAEEELIPANPNQGRNYSPSVGSD